MMWKETGASLWFTLYVWEHVCARGYNQDTGKKGDMHTVMRSPPVKQWDTVWSRFDTFEVSYLKYLYWHEVDSLNSKHQLLGLATVFSHWLYNTYRLKIGIFHVLQAPQLPAFTSLPQHLLLFFLIMLIFRFILLMWVPMCNVYMLYGS